MKAALRNPLLWVACAILLCVVVIAVTQVISCSARWQHKQEIKQSENEFSRKAKIEAARSQIGAFGSAIDLYRLTLDQYPPSLDALRVAPADLPDPTKWDGPYLAKEIPPDPWGREYKYIAPGRRNPDSYDLWSAGPDGVDNTKDDIVREER